MRKRMRKKNEIKPPLMINEPSTKTIKYMTKGRGKKENEKSQKWNKTPFHRIEPAFPAHINYRCTQKLPLCQLSMSIIIMRVYYIYLLFSFLFRPVFSQIRVGSSEPTEPTLDPPLGLTSIYTYSVYIYSLQKKKQRTFDKKLARKRRKPTKIWLNFF